MPTRSVKKKSTAKNSAASRRASLKRTSAKKTSAKKSPAKKRWVRKVNTDSTHPPKDLFTKSATKIARLLASKKVSPKGPGSGMRMLTYFINRGGKGLSALRRRTLERAKGLLHVQIEKEKNRAAS